MQDGDFLRRRHARQRLLQLQRFFDGLVDEAFDRLLAPGFERVLAEAAAETLGAREADAEHLAALAIEHLNAGVAEKLVQLVLLARVPVVIAEHGDDRYFHGAGQFLEQDLSFFGRAVVGEVAAQEQDVGAVGDLREEGLEGALRSFGAVQIGDGRDAHAFFRRGGFFGLPHVFPSRQKLFEPAG